MNSKLRIATHADPRVGTFPESFSDGEGRFRVDRLVPGQRYNCEIYRHGSGYAGLAFDNLVLKPGETRNLGDIRWRTAVDVPGE